MRTILLLELLILITRASAGGYQGALERVWIYYAYVIDGLNDPSQRTLGFKCVKEGTNKSAWDGKQCKGVWQACEDRFKAGRCNFNQLMVSLGKVRPNENFVPGSDPNTQSPDVKQTAVNYYNTLTSSNVKQVPNYPPECFLKSTNGEYMDFIDGITKVVTKARPTHASANAALFNSFADATDRIVEARVGDHGPFLISSAQAELDPKGVTIHTMKVGDGLSPVKDSKGDQAQWNTIDWQATIQDSKLSELETLSVVTDFNDKFYSGKSANQHITVIEGFKSTVDKMRTC